MSLENIKNKFYDKVINYKVVTRCAIIGIAAYIGLMIIAVVVAMTLGPNGYGLETHFMSDLGDSRVTPAPWIYDFTAILAGVISIPASFYLKRLLAPKLPEDVNNINKKKFWLGNLGLIFALLGNLGYIARFLIKHLLCT